MPNSSLEFNWPARWGPYRDYSPLIHCTNGEIEWFIDGKGKAWPRPYLSHSQIECWVRSEGNDRYEYLRRYFYNDPLPTTPAMALGSRMASMLEHRDQKTGDPMLDHYRTFLPHYEHREKEVCTIYGDVPLLAKPDGFNINPADGAILLGEYKTGKSWTQERADESEQITLYDLVFWKRHDRIPSNILHWIPTYREHNQVVARGDFIDFPTIRTEDQLIKFGAKAIMVWNQIGDRYAAELRAIGL